MAASASVQLLSTWPSFYAMRVEVALALKGVAYETVPQDLSNKSKLLLESNPVHKKIPVLLHGDKAICESIIIVQYVDEAWPSPKGRNLLPADSFGRAKARFWADFVDKKMLDVLVGVLKASLKGAAAEEKKAAEENLMVLLSNLEGVLVEQEGKGPFFGGEEMGLVDVVVAPLVPWLPAMEELAELDIPWATKLPQLQAALAAIRSHPATAELPEPAKIKDFASTVLIPRFMQA